MIQIKNLSKSYGNLSVLRNIDLHIKKGSIFGLVGCSGVGKSTLLRCINGLEHFDDGDLLIEGRSIKKLSEKDARLMRKDVGMIFQNFSLLERLDVYDNIALPMKCWKYDTKEIDRRIHELLDLVKMPEKIHSRPRELSGGQKQRVAIARALSMQPKILLCDEATSALDPQIAKSVINLLTKITDELGITTVVVTHQMEVARACCDEIAILEGGQVAAIGRVEDIFWEQPLALHNLVGEKEYPDVAGYATIKILINDPGSFRPITSQMVRDLGVDFDFLGGNMDRYRGGIIGSSVIRAKTEDIGKIKQYLDDYNVVWKEVRTNAEGVDND